MRWSDGLSIPLFLAVRAKPGISWYRKRAVRVEVEATFVSSHHYRYAHQKKKTVKKSVSHQQRNLLPNKRKLNKNPSHYYFKSINYLLVRRSHLTELPRSHSHSCAAADGVSVHSSHSFVSASFKCCHVIIPIGRSDRIRHTTRDITNSNKYPKTKGTTIRNY